MRTHLDWPLPHLCQVFTTTSTHLLEVVVGFGAAVEGLDVFDAGFIGETCVTAVFFSVANVSAAFCLEGWLWAQ